MRGWPMPCPMRKAGSCVCSAPSSRCSPQLCSPVAWSCPMEASWDSPPLVRAGHSFPCCQIKSSNPQHAVSTRVSEEKGTGDR